MTVSGRYIRTAEHRMNQSIILSGHKRTDAQRKNISKGKLKFYASPEGKELREKMSQVKTGKILSKETKLKISILHKGKIVSPEIRAKMNQDKKGKPLSIKHRNRISNALTGRKRKPFTEEHKANMRKAKNRKEK